MNWLLEKIENFGSRNAVCYKNSTLSYLDIHKYIADFKSLIAKEIPSKCVIALVSDYTPQSIALFLALMDNKNVIVPITTSNIKEINERVNESNVDIVINLSENDTIITKTNVLGTKHSLIYQLQEINDSGLVLFSSGSTGEPKAMLHNLDSLLNNYKREYTKDINTLIFLTFDHIGGIDTLFRQLSIGATITIPENRDPGHICRLIEKYKVNVLPTTPTFLNLLFISEIYKSYDLSSLRIIGYGAEPMPEYLLKKIIAAFPNVKIQQKFGTSETSAFKVTNLSPDSLFMKIDDPNVEYKIVDNELWLKSKIQILGYLNKTLENFTEESWFKTGDLVETTENGYIKIVGRKTEIINVGGEKVSPTEIESVLLQMPAIADCMVYGENNAFTGQIVVADIVLKDIGEFKVTRKDIRSFCSSKMDNFKIPTKINFVKMTNFNKGYKKIRRK
jgi:acyl-coenzyme A synthetase/AMP-(fatty) acid ligase